MNKVHEWLGLIEVSGPFLAVPVLREVFPQGLEALPPGRAQRLRSAYEEWRDAVDADDRDLPALHQAWIDEVLSGALEIDEKSLRRGDSVPQHLAVALPVHGITIAPDVAVVNPTRSDEPLLLVHVYEPEADLEAMRRFDGLAITPADRMVLLLRAAGCTLGIVTNGERWMLVHAPRDSTASVTSVASWYARLWGQEPETLRAFVCLLGFRRFFLPAAEQLPAMFERSLKHQDDVTEALGEQVRRAVEVLVQALDRADQDRNRELLRDVQPRELYEAGLTVMMRLVFLLAAEERGLLLLGDPRYDAFYAVSSLRMQLRADSEEILERRRSAWSRLLALFRGVYGGIEHPTLRLPALGGSLFDPDRYPFLEGRKKGTSWRTYPAEPLPIDDRTVLLLLEAIQTFDGRALSYRALGVEQIGHVYEGLLERTVKRVDELTLELEGSSSAKNPRVTLGEIESAKLDGRARLVELLRDRSGRSEAAIRNALESTPDEHVEARLLTVCRGDVALRDRILPYTLLLRTDPWDYPLVHHRGAFVVMLGSDRRETGTHYTPVSLTEKIVEETLTPLVYRGPAEGKARAEWELRGPEELLDLKICDPAMGSAAFLVQACRWLAERVVEAWSSAEAKGTHIDSEGRILEAKTAEAFEPLSKDAQERAILARRLIAERCLYGVDRNPLAVELAKLSLWLTTLAKGRPFGFLDHNLRSGDSLFGLHDAEQLVALEMRPARKTQLRLFGRSIHAAVEKALELRECLRAIPIRDIRDVEAMAVLDAQSREQLALPETIADAFIGIVLAEERESDRAARVGDLAALADSAARCEGTARQKMRRRALEDLAKDNPDGTPRKPFHWPLAFPEVFQRKNGGFDAFVGNPPFLGGQRITGVMGTAFRDWLVEHIADGRRGSADLVAYFFLRVLSLLREDGGFGLLAVNTIAEGDTRQVGLEAMLRSGAVIHAAYPNEPWPGDAAVVTSRVHVRRGKWQGNRCLSGKDATHISAFLSGREEWSPKRLKANENSAFIGSYVLGMGFVLSPDEAKRMLDADRRNAEVIFPYLNGEDLNSDPEQRPSRWVINFWDWGEERARQYRLPWRWIEERVKPERQRRNDKGEFVLRRPLPERWWQFGEKRPALYHAVGRGLHFERHPEGWDKRAPALSRVLVVTRVSKTLAFNFMTPDMIYSEATVVFAADRADLFALLQSNIHAVFAWQHSSRLKQDLRYSPTDAFEPFPKPSGYQTGPLEPMGESLDRRRREVMRSEGIGLTRLYTRLHARGEQATCFKELRALQQDIDRTIADAYGWSDLDLGHDFHPVPYLPENDRVRFTISEQARVEILRRLSELNRVRYQEEVERGLHETADGGQRIAVRRSKSKSRGASEPTLDFGASRKRSAAENVE